jgi:hypothetical protein
MRRISHRIDGQVVDGASSRTGVMGDPALGEQQAASRWPDPATPAVDLGFPENR